MPPPLRNGVRRGAACFALLAIFALTCPHGAAAQSAASAAASAPATASLELVVLGSGGPGATGRAGSSYVVLVDGLARILVDAGPGSFVPLGEAKLSLAMTDIVLLTHLHIDHVGELPGFLKARAVASRGPIKFKIFGPEGRQGIGAGSDASFPSTRRFVDLLFGPQGAFGYLRDFSAPMTLETTDLAAEASSDPQPKVIYNETDLTISAVAGHHRDAPAVIYRIEHAGKSIVFSGDIDADGLPGLKNIARGASLLVLNAVVLDPPGSPAPLYALHTPPRAIGALANQAQAKRLLLSHLSPAIEQARGAVEASIRERFTGGLEWARDGQRLIP
jgi:ribonuclease BN (tRNA processing enzyme)